MSTARPQKTAGNLRDKVDRDLLHAFMWKHADRNHRWLGRSGQLAEDLGINASSMSIILREMITEGRIKKVNGKFFITDPAQWAWKNPTPDVSLF